MTEMLVFLRTIILGLIVVGVILVIILNTTDLFGEAKDVEYTKASFDKISGFLKLSGEPTATCIYWKEGDQYRYKVNVNMDVTSTNKYDVYSSIKFKKERALMQEYDTENPEHRAFTVDKNGISSLSGTYIIKSSEPPLINPNNNLISQVLEPEQKVLIGNFLVEFKDFIKVRREGLSDIVPVIPEGPCSAYLSIGCKTGFDKSDFLYLKDENKKCDEQEPENQLKCRKTYTLCNGELSIILNDFKEKDKECPYKQPHFTMHADKPAEKWEMGEELWLAVWVIPSTPSLQDCWEKEIGGINTIDEDCFNDNVGLFHVIIPECSLGQ